MGSRLHYALEDLSAHLVSQTWVPRERVLLNGAFSLLALVFNTINVDMVCGCPIDRWLQTEQLLPPLADMRSCCTASTHFVFCTDTLCADLETVNARAQSWSCSRDGLCLCAVLLHSCWCFGLLFVPAATVLLHMTCHMALGRCQHPRQHNELHLNGPLAKQTLSLVYRTDSVLGHQAE